MTAELQAITTGDGELSRLRSEVEAAREDMTRVLADLDVQAARADRLGDRAGDAADGVGDRGKGGSRGDRARDLDGIDAGDHPQRAGGKGRGARRQRSSSQARIADLTAQLSTATRTAESATERSADLESRLDAAMAARDEAVGGGRVD